MAAAGDYEGFWRSRQKLLDPVAKAGLESLHPKNDPIDALFGGRQINERLEAYSRVYANRHADLTAIRRDLTNAYINSVDNDRAGKIGLLNPAQIAKYHHEVFAKHGLPATAFGGTPFTGKMGDIVLTYPLWAWFSDVK